MNVVLYCLGQKALVSLKKLNITYISYLNHIIIGKDANVENDYSKEILEWASSNNIAAFFRNDNIPRAYASFSGIHIAIGWRWILQVPKEDRLIVFHDSLLPKLRGFNPLVTALINGEEEIGVTALFGDANYDEGDIIGQSSVTIDYPIKIEEAIEKVSKLYSDLLNKILNKIQRKEEIQGFKQDPLQASYSLWRDDEDYKIDWSRDSHQIVRFINAVGYPYLGACCYLDDKKIKILEAEIYPDVKIVNRSAGKLIFKTNNEPVIVCGQGLLKIKKACDSEGKIVIFKKFRIKLK